MASSGLRYKDKVTIVTGGAKGMGEGCVRVFVKNGSKVVFCDIAEKEGKALEEKLNTMGPGQARFIKVDVTKEDELKALIDKTVEEYGRIDCLINNVGTHPPFRTIDDVSADDFRDILNLNVVSHFLTSKFALPYLRKTEGNIIHNASMVGHLGQPGAVTYVATKGAISAMARALAIDEAKYNVRINTISPSNVWTPLWESVAKQSSDMEALVKFGANAQLLGRFGTIEEFGLTCLYLAADATFCTGIDIPFSGGAELNYGNKNTKTENNDIYK